MSISCKVFAAEWSVLPQKADRRLLSIMRIRRMLWIKRCGQHVLHCDGQLWCVFGCGGDRDKGKRPQMAKIAEQLADHIVITDDNPRTEDAAAIINDIVQGLDFPNNATIIQRKQALVYAFACANDVILVAGKGHEDYQIIGHTKHHFLIVKSFLNY